MRSVKQTPVTSRTTPLLVFLSILPVVAYVLLSYLGLISLAKLAVIGAAAAISAVVCFSRPRLSMLFMVFYIYAGLSFYLPGPTAPAVMMLVTAAVLADAMRGKSILLPEPAFLWSLSLFALFAVQSMLWAQSFSQSIVGFSHFAKALLVVFLLFHLMRTPEELLKLGRWIFIGGVATVVLGFINMKLGIAKSFDPHGGITVPRFSGAHGNPNYAATFMLSTLPMGVFIIRYIKGSLSKVLAVIGVLVVIIGTFATLSRSAIFAFTAIVLGVLFKEVRSRKIYPLLLALIAVGVLLTPRYYWMRLWEMTEIVKDIRHDYSIYVRFAALKQSWQLFIEHPLTGIGLNNFVVRSGTELFKRIGVHNAYLEVLCGVGIFGAVAYLSVIFSALRQCILGIRAQWPARYASMRHFSFYLMLSLVSVLISAIFASIEFNYALWVPIAGALIIGAIRRKECTPSN